MKELVLVFSPSMKVSQTLVNNPKFSSLIKHISKHVPIKNVIVNDEKTRRILINADRNNIPLLLVDTGDDLLEISRPNFIMKFLTDLEENIKISKERKNFPEISEEEEEEVEEDEESTPVYKNIFFAECIKLNNIKHEKYDLIVISENCKKNVHFEDENILYVSTANLDSLKSIVSKLGNKNILVVTNKNRKLVDIVTALYMFHIEKQPLNIIEKTSNLQIKGILKELFLE